MRRTIDLVLALEFLVITFPLFVVVALAIKLNSPGPIFYAPQMLGQFGKPFRLYRFRTMYMDHAQRAESQRFSPVGEFIRHYSLDHLPLLINLLRGDVTLVGPRPMEPSRVDLEEVTWQRYCRAKPGVFNYAVLQLGRKWTPASTSHPSLNQELELEYGQRRTPWQDARLVIRWFRGLIASRGNVKARGEPDSDADQRIG